MAAAGVRHLDHGTTIDVRPVTACPSRAASRRSRRASPGCPPSKSPLVSGAEVEAAAELLAGVVRHTPLGHSRALADRVGGPVWLKCENLQRTGSFKIRGAYTRISRLTDEERARGVVAASAGNHAQGVALAARLLGCSATVFMPETAPLPKVAATRAYGAEIQLVGQTLTEALVAAAEHAERTGRCSSIRSTTPTSSPGRAPSASRSSSSAPTSPPSSSAPAAGGWSPGSRPRSSAAVRTCGSSPCRPRAPRLPRLARRRAARRRCRDGDDGRRDRRRRPG